VGDILECFNVQKISAVEAAGQSSAPSGRK